MTLRISLIAFGLATTALAGCDSKVSQCNKMVEVLNAAATKMDGYSPDESDLAKSAATSREMAELASSTKTKLEAIELGDDKLKQFRADYVKVLDGMASNTATMADYMDAMAKMGPTAGAEANDKLKETRKAIEGLCTTATDPCKKVSDVMAKVPEEPAEDELPKVLQTYATDLEAIELEGPLDDAVSKHIAAANAFKTLVVDSTELRTKVEATDKALGEVIERERALVEQINDYCGG